MSTQPKGIENRFVFIDYLRVIAIISVALCHSVEGVYTHNADYLGTISDLSNLFRIGAFAIGRTFGVPFFLMISGYLLLDRLYDKDATKRFFSNNWKHLVICTLIWFAIYDVYAICIMKEDISWVGFVKDLLLLKNPPLSHQWYLPMIIGFYTLIPFTANALNKSNCLRMLRIPYLMVFVYASVVPFANLLLKYLEQKPLSSQINMGFTGGVFGLYIISGFLIKKDQLRKIPTAVLVLASILSLSAIIAFVYICYRTDYIVWYDSPFVIIASISVFELASRARKFKPNRLIVFLAKTSFAVYLLHMLIRNLPVVRDAISQISLPLQSLLLTIIIVVASYLLAGLLSKTKIGRYILYIK